MLKDIVVLEINSKKGVIGQIEVETPSEFMLANYTEQILNCHVFNEFIDNIFDITIEELSKEFDEKINSVYVTFINEYDEFVCSIVIDKLNPKKKRYRVGVLDWQSSEYVFKYEENVNDI